MTVCQGPSELNSLRLPSKSAVPFPASRLEGTFSTEAGQSNFVAAYHQGSTVAAIHPAHAELPLSCGPSTPLGPLLGCTFSGPLMNQPALGPDRDHRPNSATHSLFPMIPAR